MLARTRASKVHADGRRYGGTHSYGLIPDPKVDVPSASRFLAGASLTPSSASLAKFRSPIRDQSPLSACVGFATGAAIECAFAVKGQPIAPRSRQGIYTIGRCAAREGMAPIDDRGSVPSVVMQALTDWGAPSEASWPFDPSTVNADPDLAELEAADVFKIRGFYRIDTFGAERLDEIMLAIAAGHCCAFAVSVDRAFEDWNGRGTIGAPTGPSLGGHYLLADEFTTTASGLVVTGPNSWSSSWGDGGLFHGDESFIAGWSSIYIVDPAVVS